ncbi:hypothetical protein [Stenotrophomonas sp. SMYL8]|uniref:hypothetical protein n=1 Tax=Stenotrophomonas sp. SMYL8 TaxID=3076041 RepID=UPI002E79E743|nr:hypothetical protein [Stenotrophomonas sp. SMYL8]
MSNDNKTLADAQPGGRVRLGDQAERTWPFVESPGEFTERLRAAMQQFPLIGAVRHVLIENPPTLSAQPSPGGQDALKALDDLAAFCSDDTETVDRHVAVIRAALSAQPSLTEPGGLNYERMFVDACAALAEVSRELGCDPEQGGAEPILAAIAELRAAQPSPGGQGDSRSEKAATFLRQYLTYLRSSPRQGLRPRWCDVYEALEVAIEALTARQPSKQPDSVALGEATEFCIEKGDRQPVGESVSEKLMRLLRERAALPESVELSYQRDGDGTGRAWWDRRHAELEAQGYCLDFETDSGAEWYALRGIGDELRAALAEYDAARPAQAVDLDAIRDAVCGIALVFDGDLPYIKGIAEALALIDSQVEVSRG